MFLFFMPLDVKELTSIAPLMVKAVSTGERVSTSLFVSVF